ncbi:alpha/beta fold hydrolase [Nocardia sp. NPDC051570]|uniref:alpha/beta fold hydrolase n=1 Tax=Nocardia sp. NPDC051570 TaxID=3364324 RepID=UPI0037BAD8DE
MPDRVEMDQGPVPQIPPWSSSIDASLGWRARATGQRLIRLCYNSFMPNFRTFDGLELNYTVWTGDGRRSRPVLLQHGFIVDTDANWLEPGVVAALGAAGFTVIGLDGRGHGRSAKPHDPAKYGEDKMARDISALLDELGLGEVNLVGYSMGSLVALMVTVADSRVHSLTVGGVGSGVVDLGTVDTRVGNDDAIVESLLATEPATLPAGPATQFRKAADRLDADRLALVAVLSAGHAKVTGLDTIAVPTLVLVGQDDPFAAEPERLAAAIPGGRLVKVSGDHMSAITDPAFSATLVDFLVELDT